MPDLYDKCKEAGILPVLEQHGLRWQERREGYSEMSGWAWDENGRTAVFPLTDALAEHVVCSIAQDDGANSSDGPVVMNYGDYGENEWKVMIYAEGMAYKPVYSTRLDACIAMLRLCKEDTHA